MKYLLRILLVLGLTATLSGCFAIDNSGLGPELAVMKDKKYTCVESKSDLPEVASSYSCKKGKTVITLVKFNSTQYPYADFVEPGCVDRYGKASTLRDTVIARIESPEDQIWLPILDSLSDSPYSLFESCPSAIEAKAALAEKAHKVNLTKVAQQMLAENCSNPPAKSKVKVLKQSRTFDSIQGLIIRDYFEYGPVLFKKDGTPYQDKMYANFAFKLDDDSSFYGIYPESIFWYNSSGEQLAVEDYPEWSTEDLVQKMWDHYGCPSGYFSKYYEEVVKK